MSGAASKWTAEVIAQVRAWQAEGVSNDDIATRLGTNRKNLLSAIRRLTVLPLNTRQWTPELVAEAVKLREANLTRAKIAERLGVKEHVIKDAFRTNNLTAALAKLAAPAKPAEASPAAQPCKFLARVGVHNECHQWKDRVKLMNARHRKTVCETLAQATCVWLRTINPERQTAMPVVTYHSRPVPEGFYSTRQLAAIFRYKGSEHAIYRWIQHGWLQHMPRAGKGNHGYYFSREQVEAFLHVKEAWPTYTPDRIRDPHLRAIATAARAEQPVAIATRREGNYQAWNLGEWTEDEDAQIWAMRQQGMSWTKISLAIRRSRTSCQHRYRVLIEENGEEEAA